jgi:DNA polymerase-3 subunit alpha
MLERFPAEYVAESARIAEMAEQIDLDSKTYHIPIFCERPDAEIRRRVYAGLSERYDMTASDRSDKMSRADYELEAICKAGFSSYMLIVADIYDFMRKEHIPYGAGRGSAAGSIVAYALGVTDVDPLRFGLLFERFINPERVSLPDIDMDISQERREEVIQYVKNRWGESNVAQIITFTTLGGRAAIRDVGRVLNIPLTETDRLAKMVPLNGSLTRDRESRHYLRDAIGTIKGLKDAYHNSPTAKALLDQAMELEGVVKAASLHAAGVVIADAPLESYVPVTVLKDTNKRERLATAYDMNQLEDQGLIKFDFLGLRNVDVVDKAIKDMKRDGAVPESFDKSQIPYDDDKTYRMLSRGLTAGVFQLESTGMRKWLRELKPSVVEDVMAMVALYRPGPMESIPSFVRRKHGEELIVYPHPLLEEPLRETYGVPVYQEQLMEIGRRIAGWTLARADQLRKVIGKKIVDKIEEEKEQFVEDAVKQGHERQWAEDLFTHFIEPAARYSFNKSHACAYGDLAYKTAWLKANFPTHYFAALMTSVAGDTEKLSDYVSDARALGIAILPPDVHESGHGFTPIPQKRAVRFGLSAIKNVGSQAVDLIIEQRAQGNFSDFFDFVSRTRNRLVTSRTIESLIYAGALDLLPGSRAEKLHSVSDATTRADELQEDLRRTHAGERAKKRRNPIPEAVFTGELPLVTDQDLLAKERELIGIYLSEHPFTKIAAEARAKSSCDLHALRELNHGMRAVVCGIVTKLREHQTKSKKQMLFATIEDDAVSLEVTVFPRQYDACASAFKLDRPVVLQGSLEITMSDNEIEGEEAVREVKFICDTARPFEHASLMKPIAIQPSTPAASSPLADNYAEPVIEQASRSDVFRNVTLTADNYREIIEQIGQDFHNYKSIDVRFVLPNNDEIFVTNKRASALAMPDAEPAFY